MSIANKFFKEVLGLDSDTVKKVISTIKASGSGQQFQDSMIRRRIGSRALLLLQNAMDVKESESGTEAKNGEQDKKESDKKESDKKESNVKENFTLSSFLVNEAMVDVDLSNPQAAQQQIRKAARISKDPSRLTRMQMMAAKEKKAEAAETEGPTKSLKLQIARKQQEITMLNKRLRDMEKRESGQ